MKIFLVFLLLFLVFVWVAALWAVFFKKKGKKKTGAVAGREEKIAQVQSLIKRMETENPEMVKQIREQFFAETKLKEAKNTAPGEIGEVVKHWMLGEGDTAEKEK